MVEAMSISAYGVGSAIYPAGEYRFRNLPITSIVAIPPYPKKSVANLAKLARSTRGNVHVLTQQSQFEAPSLPPLPQRGVARGLRLIKPGGDPANMKRSHADRGNGVSITETR